MRHYQIVFLFALLATVLLPANEAHAQQTTHHLIEDESRIWVEGESNRDDWVVHASGFSGAIHVNEPRIERVELKVPSGEITSDQSTIMDRLIHTALKVTEHPTISFIIDEPTGTIAGDGLQFQSTGRLTLAGETRDVVVDVSGERRDDGSFQFTGSAPITMSDFGIRPPVAMFGALRTADDVVVHFDIVSRVASD